MESGFGVNAPKERLERLEARLNPHGSSSLDFNSQMSGASIHSAGPHSESCRKRRRQAESSSGAPRNEISTELRKHPASAKPIQQFFVELEDEKSPVQSTNASSGLDKTSGVPKSSRSTSKERAKAVRKQPSRSARQKSRRKGGSATAAVSSVSSSGTQPEEISDSEELALVKEDRDRLMGELDNKNDELERMRQDLYYLRGELSRSQASSDADRREVNTRQLAAASRLETLMRSMLHKQMQWTRKELNDRMLELGRLVTHRTGPHSVQDYWEDGNAFQRLNDRRRELFDLRERLEKRKKALQLELRRRKSKANKAAASHASASSAAGGHTLSRISSDVSESSRGSSPSPKLGDLTLFNFLETEETIKVQLLSIKREEADLDEELTSLNARKAVLLRDIKRIRDEDNSRFSQRPVLRKRYLLLDLLGKGGFSEVWRALDLVQVEEVAVKIHQLSSAWSEAKKQNYIKHATREYAIHKTLVHPHVVRLYDVFEIDRDSFATVLEFCRGTDLDRYLKEQISLSEREARAIIVQVLAALLYLNGHEGDVPEELCAETVLGRPAPPVHERRPRVIHYDLKPGNILFDEHHMVKVTDFGLSKVLDEQEGSCTSLELTSQGAGTYWYLPPECFHTGGTPPRISNKVDVWSVGVILYQSLYGKRPFGEGQTQDHILSQGVMLRATDVQFPSKPPVSDDCKKFIRRCLTYHQSERPDVVKICTDPYLRKPMSGR